MMDIRCTCQDKDGSGNLIDRVRKKGDFILSSGEQCRINVCSACFATLKSAVFALEKDLREAIPISEQLIRSKGRLRTDLPAVFTP